MNISEGLERVATALRWLGLITFVSAVCFFHFVIGEGTFWMKFFMSLTFGAVPLGAAYGVAWIIDGFAGRERTRAPRAGP